jgi:hypothetical protein
LPRSALGLAQFALICALTLAAGALASGYVRSQIRAIWVWTVRRTGAAN